MVEGPGVECGGRGDLGVRFDVSTRSTQRKPNELRGEAGKGLEPAVPELVEVSKTPNHAEGPEGGRLTFLGIETHEVL